MLDYEVLAPVGSWEALEAAVSAGADAVYVGGLLFGARAFANNFDREQMFAAIDYVHLHHKKIYMTVNTLLKEKEMKEQLFDYLLPFYEHGLDAVIVQDFGVFYMVRECFPDLDIHISTQMGIMSREGAGLMKEQGASRVVPARELSLSEVAEITAVQGLEVECFVHGALCYCYSGHCFLSSRIGGRSGNRGCCAQPCRLPYTVSDGGKETKSYLLSPKDLCTIDLLPELLLAGVCSFKIEGRMKKPEYVGTVTSIYVKYARLACDVLQEMEGSGFLQRETYFSMDDSKKQSVLQKIYEKYRVERDDKIMLLQIFNREGSTKGYYHQHNGKEMMAVKRVNHNGLYLGRIERIGRNTISFHTEMPLYPKDILEIRLPDGKRIELTSPVEKKQGELVTLNAGQMRKMAANLPVYRMKSPRYIEKIKESGCQLKEKLEASLILHTGEPLQLTISDPASRLCITITGEMVQKALTQPLDRARVEKALRQNTEENYAVTHTKIDMDENAFVSIKGIKELRRQGIAQIKTKYLQQFRREIKDEKGTMNFMKNLSVNEYEQKTSPQKVNFKNSALVVSVRNFSQFQEALSWEEISQIYMDITLFSKNQWEEMYRLAKEKTLIGMLPRMVREENGDVIKEQVLAVQPYVDGYVVRTMDGLALLYHLKTDKKLLVNRLILDDTIYQYNSVACQYVKHLVEEEMQFQIAGNQYPYECTFSEMQQIGRFHGMFPVYGCREMMTSAQCVRKTLSKCDHQNGSISFKDRKDKEYVSMSNCALCYSEMIEKEPLYAFDSMRKMDAFSPDCYRMDFTIESREQMHDVLSLWKERSRT